ncbi:hypothetical protein N657DRAFT_564681 [Parathielavia appendiculata]|uniref:HECT-type E3 ubiquitin transferase n=1 Tax=Parathielavia appendiculata TaxID=2587402 RepID=A0AAN6U662_9PEZI|nr:hypothetical protein N657DRAFT_564681 [Parathielavia appendiculata]
MFPTFTGSSRKGRNVNLSGQRAINPFTSTSWAPSTAAGASKTVAHAQAERLQRQQERERLKAAQRIQRTWRAYRSRRILRAERRQAVDLMYAHRPEVPVDVERRTIEAIPLVLSFYQVSHAEDHQRLCLVARDLLQTKFSCFASGAVELPRLGKLARIVVASLESLDPNQAPNQAQVLLEIIIEIIRARPGSVQAVLGRFYWLLGRYCHSSGSASPLLNLIRIAVGTPLSAANAPESFTQTAYHEFAVSFLTQADLFLFEANITSFAADIDVDCLSDSLSAELIADSKWSGSQTGLMWLLAHFIVLQKTRKQLVLHSRSLRVLYSLLAALSTEIRVGFSVSELKASVEARDIEEGPQPSLPPYVSDKLASLTDRDEISGLLEKFTSDHWGTSASELEDAGFLAGYILTLVYCFPTLSDDIRMRLYLANIPTRHGSLPVVKFFWNALSRTSIFSTISADADAALTVLRQRPASETDSPWHREWRTILLFLELYIFVLRLTDDDDFFSGLSLSAIVGGSGSRLRSSALNLQELKRLTIFLKHLGFTLYYSASDLLGSAPSTSSNNPTSNVAPFALTAGVDFHAFRDLVSTAMRMLYERDSRRPFLPQSHWLMTSKFDMEGFLSAVVLEEQRRREQAEAGDEDQEDGVEDEEPLIGLSSSGLRLSRQAHMERIRLARKRAARDTLRAAAGPKLEILRNMPFVIPFDMRVQIFRQFVYLDKSRRRGGNIDPDRWRLWVLNQHGGPFEPTVAGTNILGRHQAQIQRGKVFNDAMGSFWDLGEGLKEPIQITFVDEFGIPEAGIDGGGVTKEFLTSVTSEAFTPAQRLFVANSKNSYYPNPCDMDQTKYTLKEAQIAEGSEEWAEAIAYRLRQYEFLGRVIGKCMYEGILIDIAFAGFFLLKWASSGGSSDTYRANINDLRELDEELYQGMLRLKNYPGDVLDLSLDFTITDQVSLPGEPVRTITRNLVPNGEDVLVTNENRPLYISYVARHRLVVQPYAQTRAFLRGLGMIIDPAWLSMFNQNELQRLVGGDSSEIDVEDLRRHTHYSGVYAIGDDGEEHPTVKLFWEVMHGLEDPERREVLKYVTSTPRAPLLGFSQLSPPFSIRDGGTDQERLPSASTCVNLLKLPQYRTAAVLKRKLLYAVKSGAGFDLS